MVDQKYFKGDGDKRAFGNLENFGSKISAERRRGFRPLALLSCGPVQ